MSYVVISYNCFIMSNSKSPFLASLHEANSKCRSDANVAKTSLAIVREQATDYFLESLLTSPAARSNLERECLTRATLGQKTYRLTTWTGSGPDYCGQKLPDLLDLGNLLVKMQDWLDVNYRTDNNRFRVFNCRVRNAPRNTFNLIVSWNEDKFETADKIIETNRQTAIERRDTYDGRRQGRPQDDDNEEAHPEDAVEHEDRSTHRPYDNRQRGLTSYRQDDNTKGGGSDERSRWTPRPRYNDGNDERGRGPPRPRYGEHTTGSDDRARGVSQYSSNNAERTPNSQPPRRRFQESREEVSDERNRVPTGSHSNRTETVDSRRRAAPAYNS